MSQKNNISPSKAGTDEIHSRYAVFDSLLEGAQVIDHNWRYVYANDAVAKHGKTTIDNLLGQTMMEKYPGIEKTDVFKEIRRCMLTRVSHRMTNRFKYPDGTIGWFELSIEPVPEGVLVLSFDISRQKNAEEELAKKLIERTQLLNITTKQKEQLDEFSQIISHNLRGPLANLMLIQDMIKSSGGIKEKLMYIEMQGQVINSLHETFEELISATQVRNDLSVKKERIDLRHAIERTLGLLKPNISNIGAVITYNLEEIKTVNYSVKYLDSILYNLLSNAIKYRSPDRTPKIHIKSYVKDGWVCLDIKDNGLGLDLNKYGNKLFKLHKTFHSHPDAKGFGLYLTKSQVEAMGGKIEVKSTPGKGSTFTIKLTQNNHYEQYGKAKT